MCLINTHILKYQQARCDHKLWSAYWFYCVFRVFSFSFFLLLTIHVWIFVSPKHSQIVYLIKIFICWIRFNLISWHARCNYNLYLFLGNFNIWYVILSTFHNIFLYFAGYLLEIRYWWFSHYGWLSNLTSCFIDNLPLRYFAKKILSCGGTKMAISWESLGFLDG